MKAIVIDSYGGPDVLRLVHRPEPEPGEGQVRIRVQAAGVNPADHKWRSGSLHSVVPLRFPAVLGYDVAGVVDAVGQGVSPARIGERVVGMLGHVDKGAYAEQVLLPAEQAVQIPDALDFATAAALPTAGLTGVQAVEEHIRPQPGETVLLTGALGGVGRFALHTLLEHGARVVAAVRVHQIEEALAAGAAEALELGEPHRGMVDHLLDTVGGAEVTTLCRNLRPGGRIAYVGTTPIPTDGLASEPVFIVVRHDPARLARLAEDVASGLLAVPVAARIPLQDAAEAHRRVEAGGAGGKVVLTL